MYTSLMVTGLVTQVYAEFSILQSIFDVILRLPLLFVPLFFWYILPVFSVLCNFLSAKICKKKRKVTSIYSDSKEDWHIFVSDKHEEINAQLPIQKKLT